METSWLEILNLWQDLTDFAECPLPPVCDAANLSQIGNENIGRDRPCLHGRSASFCRFRDRVVKPAKRAFIDRAIHAIQMAHLGK
ncbi:hypothetical protein [Neotabrizicola shimadae]|uniref:Uncharacterized protein n=1 Tax=Neotabrizicola shimadae TaxID=2807096 RepID=A0A8G1ED29_9RHOB|nr:hypothetical protein [Neotabrizicola shimadae]QYZ71245.1 hypothetical protein JO391_06995 [Neotabrizicola shimadae]